MNRRAGAICTVFLAISVAASGASPVEVTEVEYGGWDGAFEVTNPDARLVIVPAIGRIMFYGFSDGPNLLWNNPLVKGQVLSSTGARQEDGSWVWVNFGGDKVWPNEQSEFENINGHGWPPDHWFDGSRHSVELLSDGVRITSPISEYNGARSIREIHLAPTGARVTINQRIEKINQAARVDLEPLSYTIWNVMQIRPPEQTLLPLNPHSALKDRYRWWEHPADRNFTVEGDIGIFVPDKSESQKAGVDSDRWLAGIVDHTVVAQFYRRDSTQAYPDSGLSAEGYTSTDYTELELLSGLQKLEVGDSMAFTIAWDLHLLPAEATTPPARRREALSWLWEQPSP